jgi:hypothetical protein
MLALAPVARNARYWQGSATGLCLDDKREGKVKIKNKDWWNGPLLRLEGPPWMPFGVGRSRSE